MSHFALNHGTQTWTKPYMVWVSRAYQPTCGERRGCRRVSHVWRSSQVIKLIIDWINDRWTRVLQTASDDWKHATHWRVSRGGGNSNPLSDDDDDAKSKQTQQRCDCLRWTLSFIYCLSIRKSSATPVLFVVRGSFRSNHERPSPGCINWPIEQVLLSCSTRMIGHQFAPSVAPVRPVKEVQFGILSPEEIVGITCRVW